MIRSVAIAVAAVVITTAAAAETPSVSVPIQPAPGVSLSPNAAPLDLSPTLPDARALSQINPTAGPVAPHKAALAPMRPQRRSATVPAAKEQRETRALNYLAAAGYGSFRDLRPLGRVYQATVDDPAGGYTVTVDPDTGRITPGSAAADRETQALNLLARHGYLDVSAIRPAGTGFLATVRQGGKPIDLEIDPTRGRITPRS